MKRILVLLFLVSLALILSGCTSSQTELLPLTPNQITSLSPTPVSVPELAMTPTTACVRSVPSLSKPVVREVTTGSGEIDFRILHINDFHSEIIENKDWIDGDYVPGAARLGTVIAEESAVFGEERTLIIDAGDWSEGGASWMQIQPEDVMEIYQQIGFDAVVIGNHEFYYGMDTFVDMVTNAGGLDLLSANLVITQPQLYCLDEPKITNGYKIIEIEDDDGDNLRIAVIGLGLLNMEKFAIVGGAIRFTDPSVEVENFYKDISPLEKPDVVVLVTHMGYDEDKRLAQALNEKQIGVDIIVGGHSHTWIDKASVVGDTIVVTAGSYGKALGILDLTYDHGTDQLSSRWDIRRIDGCVKPDPNILEFTKEHYPHVFENVAMKYVGTNVATIDLSSPNGESGIWVKQEEGDDGSTEMVEKGGSLAMTNSEGSHYIYFSVSDFMNICGMPIEVTIDYFDEGYGSLAVEYDRAGVEPEHPCSECYVPQTVTPLNNTKTWKSVTFNISDATFNNNQKWGTDLRITAYDTPIFLRSVSIRNDLVED